MKPMIVTNVAGQRRRLNPLAVIGWAGAEIPLPPEEGKPARTIMGCLIATMTGPVEVRESEANIDFMFEDCTRGMFLSPDVQAEFNAIVLDAVDARLSATPAEEDG